MTGPRSKRRKKMIGEEQIRDIISDLIDEKMRHAFIDRCAIEMASAMVSAGYELNKEGQQQIVSLAWSMAGRMLAVREDIEKERHIKSEKEMRQTLKSRGVEVKEKENGEMSHNDQSAGSGEEPEPESEPESEPEPGPEPAPEQDSVEEIEKGEEQ